MPSFTHPTSIVEDDVQIGENTKIWHFAHIRKGASLGRECILGKNVYVDSGVRIGNFVKIQNNVSVFHGVQIEDGVFVGPHVCFTNDLFPRAITPTGDLKTDQDWTVAQTIVSYGASVGANSTIVAGIKIGTWAMVGAGSVVTRDVPPYALVYGNPARIRGTVNASGEIVSRDYRPDLCNSPQHEKAQLEI